jgi:hypothetical protein
MHEAKLTSVSQPTIEGLDSAEDLIAYCARVSNPNISTGVRLKWHR